MGNRLIWVGYNCFTAPFNIIAAARPVIRCYDDAGNELSSIFFPIYTGYPNYLQGLTCGDVLVAVYLPPGDFDGNTFTGNTFRRFTRDGYEVATSINHRNGFISQFLVDSSGNTYISGEPIKNDGTKYSSGSRTGYYTIRKFDSSQNEIWYVDSGMEYFVNYGSYSGGGKICVDNNGDLIVSIAYGTSKDKVLKKLSKTDGSTIWETTVYTANNGYENFDGQVAVDSSDNIYLVGYEYDEPTDNFLARIYKYNSSGTLQSSVTLDGALPLDFKIDGSNVLHYFCADFYKTLNTSLSVTLTSTIPAGYPAKIRGGAIDNNGQAYTGYSYWTGYVDPNGYYYQIIGWDISGATASKLWDAENYYPTPKPNGDWADVSCITVVENVETPSLPLPLSLGIPTVQGDAYAAVPGLSLSVSLYAPTTLRDYLGVAPWIFRLYLTGGTGTIELPLSSVSCRKTSGGISLDVVCPGLTSDQITAIGDRSTGNLIVKRGVKLIDGTELLDELVSCALSSFRWDTGMSSASGSLSGQTTAPTVNAKTRAVGGISYRNTSSGLRRVRCNIDTFLSVGDTANLGGGESFVVAEITYYITTTSAYMEITENAT